MDTGLIYIVLLIILYLIGLLFNKIYFPKIKGRIGEFRVARRLRKLNKNNYKVYNNVYLKNNGISTQIDHLVVSVYGIFVIETKRYKGWIFGNENSEYWTQVLYKNKYKIFNPIIQNWTHVNFLKRILTEFDNLKYFPIVVFAGSGKLKKIDTSVPVIYKRKLLKIIRKHKEIHLTHNQMARIDDFLKQAIIKKKDINKNHKKFVKRNIKWRKKGGFSRNCPKCGSKLVIRNGKYGKFKGCSNYPDCRYTKK